jgi:isopenicillin-N N-acyltransferase-like protein
MRYSLSARWLVVAVVSAAVAGCVTSAPRMRETGSVVPQVSDPSAASPSVTERPTVAPSDVALVSQPAAAVKPPVPVVRVGGSPREMGSEQGRALGSTVRLLHEKYLTPFIAGYGQKVMARLAANTFAALALPEHREEVTALAEAAGVDGRDTMLAQCFLDLTPMTACSTVTLPASASPDGVARFGRNLDFPSLGVADRYTALLVYKPEGRYGFASVGWPGMIGVLSGMNEHGLTLANMEVARPARIPTAMPYTLLYRAVLEQCRTVDEAVAFLEKTPRQTANNLMLMDATGDRAAVEITPESVVVRRADAPTSPVVSTNHQRGKMTIEGATGHCDRYDYLRAQAMADHGRIDVDAIESMLRRVGGSMTLQSMVFEPSTRVMYLSAGSNAATKPFTRIELKSLFE